MPHAAFPTAICHLCPLLTAICALSSLPAVHSACVGYRSVHVGRMLKANGGVGLDLILHPGDLSYATGYLCARRANPEPASQPA